MRRGQVSEGPGEEHSRQRDQLMVGVGTNSSSYRFRWKHGGTRASAWEGIQYGKASQQQVVMQILVDQGREIEFYQGV